VELTRRVSIAQVKATLAERVREVERGEAIILTRHGRPVAALIPAEDLERLERLRAAGPESGLASLAGGWKNSDDLVRILEKSSRYGRRPTPPLD